MRLVEGYQFLDRITYFAHDGYGSLGLNVSGKLQRVVTLQCDLSGMWIVVNFSSVLNKESDKTYQRYQRLVTCSKLNFFKF